MLALASKLKYSIIARTLYGVCSSRSLFTWYSAKIIKYTWKSNCNWRVSCWSFISNLVYSTPGPLKEDKRLHVLFCAPRKGQIYKVSIDDYSSQCSDMFMKPSWTSWLWNLIVEVGKFGIFMTWILTNVTKWKTQTTKDWEASLIGKIYVYLKIYWKNKKYACRATFFGKIKSKKK